MKPTSAAPSATAAIRPAATPPHRYGKDSTVLLHLTLAVARARGRLPVDVLFVDLEGQYQSTIDHVAELLRHPDVRPWWVCLPLNLRNATSAYEPFWCAWEPGREADWVRPLPDHPAVISDPAVFPFYRYRMEFEQFVTGFNAWLAGPTPTAILVGIRADESLHRYRAVATRVPSKRNAWTPPATTVPVPWSARDPRSPAVAFFPLYDWRFSDLWRYLGEHALPYNRLYDLMYRAGVPFGRMRICQPYGDDQRQSLDLWQRLEPATWARVVQRVTGANTAARYCRQSFLGYRAGHHLPPTMPSWQAYSQFLLRTLVAAFAFLRCHRRFCSLADHPGHPRHPA